MKSTWVQPLNFVTEGFGFQANYTNVKQSTEGGTGPAGRGGGHLARHLQRDTVLRRGPGSVRLSFVHNDEQIASGTNQEGITGARFWTDATNQLDLSASYKFESLPSSPQITLNVINITGETIRQTWGNDSQAFGNAARAFYDPGYAVLLGIRGTF